MRINNKEEARNAYCTIRLFEQIKKNNRINREQLNAINNLLNEKKREVRKYVNHTSNERLVYSDDPDYYIVLIQFPGMTIDDAKKDFEDNYRLIAYPSQHDCTGQAFTTGVKFFMRNNMPCCYHRIAVDV
ncbi:MAG: hypothetical protein K6B67_05740 [Lachnospiraceae bacterium]|nr:hypothetical protein [Lachnospiraceae bacterium]